jgi:hypothetical protein
MLFPNLTNSQILSKLEINERILKYRYMKYGGMGYDLLEALHIHISPEEIFKYGKAFGITEKQKQHLKYWLESNCEMKKTMEKCRIGYVYTARSLFDNGSWGILTKIRRHVVEWEPKITKDGKIKYLKCDWLEKPRIIYNDGKTIALKRECSKLSGYIKYRSSNTFDGTDEFYGSRVFVFTLDKNEWRRATIEEKADVLNAIKVMNIVSN